MNSDAAYFLVPQVFMVVILTSVIIVYERINYSAAFLGCFENDNYHVDFL